MAPTVPRATATQETLELLQALHEKHGPLMYFSRAAVVLAVLRCAMLQVNFRSATPMSIWVALMARRFTWESSNSNTGSTPCSPLMNVRCWKNRARPDNHGNRG